MEELPIVMIMKDTNAGTIMPPPNTTTKKETKLLKIYKMETKDTPYVPWTPFTNLYHTMDLFVAPLDPLTKNPSLSIVVKVLKDLNLFKKNLKETF